jgi:Tfp pilus assembly protein PilF
VRTIGLDSLDDEMKKALLNDPLRIVRLYATLSSSSLETASDEFEREFEEYTRHTADTPVGALRYGAYWLSRGDIDKAEHNIRQATSFEHVNPGVWRLAAIQLYQLGKPQAAIEYFRKALDLSPEDPEVLFNMGLMAYEQNDVETALKYLNRAVRADPTYEDAWYNLIALYWSLQQMPTARARLQEALETNPDSPRLQQLMFSLQSQE